MENAYRNMMLAAALEVLMLPVFYWVYDAYGFLFWCLLYAMDVFLYKRMELLALLKMQEDENHRKEMYRLFFVEGLFLFGLLMLLFLNGELAGILFINDILLEGICLLKELKQKNNE